MLLFLLFLLLAPVPGAVDPRVMQSNLATTICHPGYSASVRPSASWAHRMKVRLMQQQGISRTEIALYQLDHKVPLAVGGCPTCLENLWLEPLDDASRKDRVENRMHHAVCTGKVSLAAAQQCFLHDWTRCP